MTCLLVAIYSFHSRLNYKNFRKLCNICDKAGRGIKCAAGAFRSGGKVRRGRQASVVGLAALLFFYPITVCLYED